MVRGVFPCHGVPSGPVPLQLYHLPLCVPEPRSSGLKLETVKTWSPLSVLKKFEAKKVGRILPVWGVVLDLCILTTLRVYSFVYSLWYFTLCRSSRRVCIIHESLNDNSLCPRYDRPVDSVTDTEDLPPFFEGKLDLNTSNQSWFTFCLQSKLCSAF